MEIHTFFPFVSGPGDFACVDNDDMVAAVILVGGKGGGGLILSVKECCSSGWRCHTYSLGGKSVCAFPSSGALWFAPNATGFAMCSRIDARCARMLPIARIRMKRCEVKINYFSRSWSNLNSGHYQSRPQKLSEWGMMCSIITWARFNIDIVWMDVSKSIPNLIWQQQRIIQIF